MFLDFARDVHAVCDEVCGEHRFYEMCNSLYACYATRVNWEWYFGLRRFQCECACSLSTTTNQTNRIYFSCQTAFCTFRELSFVFPTCSWTS